MRQKGSAFSFEGEVGTVVPALERPEVMGSNAERAGESVVLLVAESAGESMVLCLLSIMVYRGGRWRKA